LFHFLLLLKDCEKKDCRRHGKKEKNVYRVPMSQSGNDISHRTPLTETNNQRETNLENAAIGGPVKSGFLRVFMQWQ